MVDRASAYTNDDANTLSHDRAGLLSMRRGGGSFEFGLTPAPNPALDATRLVIGEVSEDEGEGEGGLRLVAALNAVPVRLPSPASELVLTPNPNPYT